MLRTSLLALLTLASISWASGDTLWSGLRSRYLSLKTLSGSFDENICSEQAGTCQSFSGRFYISVPGRYRLEVNDPEQQLIVSDSASVLVYLVSQKRVVRQPANGPAPVLAFLEPILDPNARGTVEQDSFGTYFVSLSGSDSMASLNDLRLELDKTATRIHAFSFDDGLGTTYHFTLTGQKWNPDLGAKLFRFTPPRGVTVEQ